MARPVALTIAGTDSGGGAGIAADLKSFEAHGVWGALAVVAVTAQNTLGVQAASPIAADLVARQVESVASDLGVQAAKTGMLATAELVEAVAAAVEAHLAGVPLVVDTVLVSKHGDPLLAADAVAAVRDRLLPLAALVTPNLPEAEALLEREVATRDDMAEAARQLVALGCGAALVKGGHLRGSGSPDCLVVAGEAPLFLEAERVLGRHTHGTGCTLSAAIAARLARGEDLAEAVAGGKAFTLRAIRRGVDLGAGVGPVDPGSGPLVDGDAAARVRSRRRGARP